MTLSYTFIFFEIMRILVEIILLVVFLTGCSRQQSVVRDNIKANIHVSFIPREDTVSLSSIYGRKVDILTLDSIVLASVSKVLRYDSLWIVKGKSAEGGVHLFSNKGHYLKPLLRWGQGPTEVFDIWAMKLYQDAVYLLANAGTEVIKYSLLSQELEWRFKVPDEVLSATDFELLSDGKFVFLKSVARKPEKEYKLYVYNDQKRQIEGCFLELDKKAGDYISFSQTDCLYRMGDKIRYYEVFRNGICQLVNGDLEGYIGFVNNKYTFPEDELYQDSYTFETFIETCENSNYIWGHRNLYEGNRFISSSYNYRNDMYWNLIDKFSNNSHSYKWVRDDLILNETSLVEEYLSMTNVQGDCHYFTLSYYNLDRLMQQEDAGKDIMPNIAHLYKTMDDGSNDLVVCLYEK